MKYIKYHIATFIGAILFCGALVAGEADSSFDRINAWRQVSSFQHENRNYLNARAKWLKTPGNEHMLGAKDIEQEFQKSSGLAAPESAKALKSAWQIVRTNPTDDLGFMAIQFVIGTVIWSPELHQTYLMPALSVLEKHYLTDKRMDRYVAMMSRMSSGDSNFREAMLAVVQKVVEQNKPGSNLRVQAAYHYANENLGWLNNTTVPKGKRSKMRRQFAEYARIALAEGENKTVWGQPARERAAILLNAVENLSIGSQLPNVKVNLVGGGEDELKNHRGKVVLLDFWATWCVPCVANLPKVAKLKEEMKGQPFEVITVSVDDSDEDVIEFMEDKMALPFVNWHIGPGRDAGPYKDWNINGVPTYFLIDDKGIIQASGGFKGIPQRTRELVGELNGK